MMMLIIMMMMLMMKNTEKLEALRLFEGFDRDYCKPIKTDDSFDGKKIAT